MDQNQVIPGTEGISPRDMYLPVGSSRQVVRAELFKRSFKSITDVVENDRSERRKIARKMTKDLWLQGERLTRKTVNSEAFNT